MNNVNPQWKGSGQRPWLQGPPITSYARNQGNSEVIYPLDGSESSSSIPSPTLYCFRQTDGEYYCAASDGDAVNGVNGQSYPSLPAGAIELATREAD